MLTHDAGCRRGQLHVAACCGVVRWQVRDGGAAARRDDEPPESSSNAEPAFEVG